MKNIFSVISFTNLKNNLVNVTKRFPFQILLLAILGILFFIMLHADLSNDIEEYFIRTEFSIVITFFLSLGLAIVGEGLKLDRGNHYFMQIISLIFGGLFFIGFSSNINDFENFIFFILTLAGIIAVLYYSPYVKQILENKKIEDHYYSFFYKISTVIIMGFILGGVTFGLGALGITAIIELFDLTYSKVDKLYGDWAIISLTWIAPIFALISLPLKKEYLSMQYKENKFFSFIIKYIATPFIYVYFIILYAYTIKVLLNFSQWPKGEVSWMVILFSIFGYLIYMFTYAFREENKSIEFFRKAFPYVVIPQIFMLFYAIYLRISQYDLTINRYFVVVFGLWLLVTSIYLVISKHKKIEVIPVILSIFVILVSVGPWGVYSLPESRQLERLKNNLVETGILKNNIITPLESYDSINQDLSNEIYTEIQYLCNFGDCKTIKILFFDIIEKIKKGEIGFSDPIRKIESQDELSNWEIINGITDYIKVQRKYEFDRPESELINIGLKNDTIFPININGYSKIIQLSEYSNNMYGKYDYKNEVIEIYKDGQIIDKLYLNKFTNVLYSRYKINNASIFTSADLTYEVSTEKGTYKIIFENLSIKNKDYTGENKNMYGYSNGYILIK